MDRSSPWPVTGVEVAVLGPVSVRGAAGPFHRSAALELVVYLAFHRRGVRHAEWALAIWPERPVSLSTVHSTCSDARRARGRAPDGSPHLPRGTDLRLRESVRHRRGAVHRARRIGRPARPSRGDAVGTRPAFPRPHRTDWAVFDGTQSHVESLVVRTASRGADRVLRRRRRRRRADRPPGVAREPIRRASLPRLPTATAAPGQPGPLRSAMAQLLTLAGEAARHPPWRRCTSRQTAAPRRRQPSTGTCSGLACRRRAPRQAEGRIPPWREAPLEIGRTCRRNWRWHHLSRADAGEIRYAWLWW